MIDSEQGAPKGRRETVWAVCDQLSSQGIKPSLRSVKMHAPRGSDTDVQKDVNGWYEQVFAQHARRRVIPALPEAVVKAMEAFWETAALEANSQFMNAREAQAETERELKEQLAAVEAALAEARVAATAADQALEAVRLALSQRTLEHEAALKDAAALRHDLDVLRREAHSREQTLLEELARSQAAQVQTLKAQREDFEAQVKLIREGAAQQAEAHQRALARADEHYRDLEHRALQEVDAVRLRVKRAEDAAERFRTLAHERDLALAGLKTELALLKTTQHTQIDELITRNATLAAAFEAIQVEIRRGKSLDGGE